MAPVSLTAKVFRFSLAAMLILLSFSSTSSAQNDVVITVGDTIAFPNTTNTVISVFVDNFPTADTIVGFKLAITLNDPLGLVEFQTDSGVSFDTTYWICNSYDIDSVCIDSTNVEFDSTNIEFDTLYDFIYVQAFEVLIGNFDTVGTLIGGWEWVGAQSQLENTTSLILVGFADLSGGGVTPGFAPQQGGLLMRLLVDVLDVPDTTTERTILLQIEKLYNDNFNLVSSDPSWSPWDYNVFLDTNGWICTQWVIDTTVDPPDTLGCGNYERTSTPPFDSIEVVLDSTALIDTTRIKLYDGTLIINETSPCGDINNDGGFGNIVDLTYLIDFIFRGGPAPNPLCRADLDCNGTCANIVDLTYLIDFIFRGGLPVCIGC